MSLTGLALLIPGGASAATLPQSMNTSADQGAMTAYHTYLLALTAGTVSAAVRANQVVDGVTNTCPGALSDLDKLSASQVDEAALTAFANEVDADLELAYIGGGSAALNRFGGALSELTWSTAAQSSTTTHLIGAERALAALVPRSLCRDAVALDAAPLSEPTATRRFLTRYRVASRTLNTDLAAFQNLLTKFETASESKLVTQIDTLAAQYASLATTVESADGSSVLSELGLSS